MSTVGVKIGIMAAMVLIGLIAIAVISRNWSCRDRKREPRPPRCWRLAVESVPNGAAIVVKSGWKNHKTATVTLADISAPPLGDPLAEASRINLERFAGKQIRVEVQRGGLFRAGTDESLGEAATVESARGDLIGVVYGETGACLNIRQIVDGMAICLPSAPAGWKAEESAAQKAKRGVWQ